MSRCCTCLEEATPNQQLYKIDSDPTGSTEINIINKLLFCVPEFQEFLDEDATMCNTCYQSLYSAYSFKKMCLETKSKIENERNQMNSSISIKEEIVEDVIIKTEPEIISGDAIIKTELFYNMPEMEELPPPHIEIEEPLLIERACKSIPALFERNISADKFTCYVAIEPLDTEKLKQSTVTTEVESDDSFFCDNCFRKCISEQHSNPDFDLHTKKKEPPSVGDVLENNPNDSLQRTSLVLRNRSRKPAQFILKRRNNKRKAGSFYLELIVTKFANLTIRRKFLSKSISPQRVMPKLSPEPRKRRAIQEETSMPILFPSTQPENKLETPKELIRKSALTLKQQLQMYKCQTFEINSTPEIHKQFGMSVKPKFPTPLNATSDHPNLTFVSESSLKQSMPDYIASILNGNNLRSPEHETNLNNTAGGSSDIESVPESSVLASDEVNSEITSLLKTGRKLTKRQRKLLARSRKNRNSLEIVDHTYSLLSQSGEKKKCSECGDCFNTTELLEIHTDNYHVGWWLSNKENEIGNHEEIEKNVDSDSDNIEEQLLCNGTIGFCPPTVSNNGTQDSANQSGTLSVPKRELIYVPLPFHPTETKIIVEVPPNCSSQVPAKIISPTYISPPRNFFYVPLPSKREKKVIIAIEDKQTDACNQSETNSILLNRLKQPSNNNSEALKIITVREEETLDTNVLPKIATEIGNIQNKETEINVINQNVTVCGTTKRPANDQPLSETNPKKRRLDNSDHTNITLISEESVTKDDDPKVTTDQELATNVKEATEECSSQNLENEKATIEDAEEIVEPSGCGLNHLEKDNQSSEEKLEHLDETINEDTTVTCERCSNFKEALEVENKEENINKIDSNVNKTSVCEININKWRRKIIEKTRLMNSSCTCKLSRQQNALNSLDLSINPKKNEASAKDNNPEHETPLFSESDFNDDGNDSTENFNFVLQLSDSEESKLENTNEKEETTKLELSQKKKRRRKKFLFTKRKHHQKSKKCTEIPPVDPELEMKEQRRQLYILRKLNTFVRTDYVTRAKEKRMQKQMNNEESQRLIEEEKERQRLIEQNSCDNLTNAETSKTKETDSVTNQDTQEKTDNEPEIFNVQMETNKEGDAECQKIPGTNPNLYKPEEISIPHIDNLEDNRTVETTPSCTGDVLDEVRNQDIPSVCQKNSGEDGHNILNNVCEENSMKPTQYKCHTCNESFIGISALKLHSVVHNYERPVEEIMKETQEKIDGLKNKIDYLKLLMYQCEKCEMNFVSKKLLKLHRAFKHGS